MQIYLQTDHGTLLDLIEEKSWLCNPYSEMKLFTTAKNILKSNNISLKIMF